MPQHRNITDPNIHEPKGVTSASAGVTYVADGSGSGAWTPLGPDGIDMAALEARLENDIANGDFNPNASVLLHGMFDNIATTPRLIFPVPLAGRITRVVFTLGGTIATANATFNVLASSGGSMGPSVVIPFSGSAKGDTYVLNTTGNNLVPENGWFEVTNTMTATNAVPVGVTAILRVGN